MINIVGILRLNFLWFKKAVMTVALETIPIEVIIQESNAMTLILLSLLLLTSLLCVVEEVTSSLDVQTSGSVIFQAAF